LRLASSVCQSDGVVSPSIYDTAQILRLQPQLSEPHAVIDWLLDQQDADGGWGTPTLPVARLVPTVASLLALSNAPATAAVAEARGAGRAFLTSLSAVWPSGVPNDLPVGMELLLPVLLDDLQLAVPFDTRPFRPIIEVGEHRRSLLGRVSLAPGSPPLHSYEALPLPAHPGLLDPVGSLSHSPSATAAWLRRASNGDAPLAPIEARAQAQAYLARCTGGTPTPARGIYPGVWPMGRFEQSFVLYFLAIAGAFELPAYREQLMTCAADLAQAMRPTGIGLSDHFAVDGDDTAAAIIAFDRAAMPVDRSWLDYFRTGVQYWAYPGERHGSISLVARAMHAAIVLGDDVTATAVYLRSQQQADGRWCHDKWHASWLYTTMHAMIAMAMAGDSESVARARSALLRAQGPDGGWGTAEETAYALLGLVYAHRIRPSDQLLRALKAGSSWLVGAGPLAADGPPLWIGKELYTPPRIVQAAQLAALIAVDTVVAQERRAIS
jgi:hypothetical protein